MFTQLIIIHTVNAHNTLLYDAYMYSMIWVHIAVRSSSQSQVLILLWCISGRKVYPCPLVWPSLLGATSEYNRSYENMGVIVCDESSTCAFFHFNRHLSSKSVSQHDTFSVYSIIFPSLEIIFPPRKSQIDEIKRECRTFCSIHLNDFLLTWCKIQSCHAHFYTSFALAADMSHPLYQRLTYKHYL